LRRFIPRHGTLVAYLALFVVLGGTTYAAFKVPPNSVGSKQLKDGSVTTLKFASGAFAPKANLAINADHATNADLATNAHHASTADEATDANQLAGSPASSFRVSCPTGMTPSGGDCIDTDVRPVASLADALAICARAQLHLADAGELAQLFDRVGASQPVEWTGDTFPSTNGLAGDAVGNDSSRTITFGSFLVGAPVNFRCATSATN
jgi:hypothetical protein